MWIRPMAGKTRLVELGEEPPSNQTYHLCDHDYFTRCAVFVILSGRALRRVTDTAFAFKNKKGEL